MWKPKNIASFVEDYNNKLTYMQLAEKYGTTYDTVRHFIKHLKKTGIEEHRNAEDSTKTTLDSFSKFLQRARLEKEIRDKFGEQTDELLASEYENLELYQNIDNWGRPIFILIPRVKEDIVLQKKNWKIHRPDSIDVEHLKQAYQLVNIPDKLLSDTDSSIIIAPLYDIHHGHYAHKKEKFASYVRWISETPNVYCFLGGDIAENALDDGRGMTYDQERTPSEQITDLCKIMAPMAHKILFSLTGNHEERTYKKTGINPAAIIADKLNIEYYDGPVYCTIVCGKNKWKIYAFHGTSSSQTKGGKLNAAGRPRIFTDFIHFYVSGHCHDPIVNPETCVVEDPERNRLIKPRQWIVICPSFLRWEGSYAYRKGWSPPGSGGVFLHLLANGDYRASLI